jgi:hypothetical protein
VDHDGQHLGTGIEWYGDIPTIVVFEELHVFGVIVLTDNVAVVERVDKRLDHVLHKTKIHEHSCMVELISTEGNLNHVRMSMNAMAAAI